MGVGVGVGLGAGPGVGATRPPSGEVPATLLRHTQGTLYEYM